jgi:hypothetical protein
MKFQDLRALLDHPDHLDLVELWAILERLEQLAFSDLQGSLVPLDLKDLLA